MGHPKKTHLLLALFAATAVLLWVSTGYLMREAQRIDAAAKTLSQSKGPIDEKPAERPSSPAGAPRPVVIDEHNDPLAPMHTPKKDPSTAKAPRASRPIYEPSQDDPDILLQ